MSFDANDLELITSWSLLGFDFVLESVRGVGVLSKKKFEAIFRAACDSVNYPGVSCLLFQACAALQQLNTAVSLLSCLLPG